MKIDFLANFDNIDIPTKSISKMRELVQKENESMKAYHKRFQEVCWNLEEPLTKCYKIEQFIFGLQKDIRAVSQVAKQLPTLTLRGR